MTSLLSPLAEEPALWAMIVYAALLTFVNLYINHTNNKERDDS